MFFAECHIKALTHPFSPECPLVLSCFWWLTPLKKTQESQGATWPKRYTPNRTNDKNLRVSSIYLPNHLMHDHIHQQVLRCCFS